MSNQHDGEVVLDSEAPKQADELAGLSSSVLLPRVDIRQGVEDDEARPDALDEGAEGAEDCRWSDDRGSALRGAHDGVLAGQGHDVEIGEIREFDAKGL
jgi:hypothetical protein